MAVKLHCCGNTWAKFGTYPCWRVQKALAEQGIGYEVVPGPWPGQEQDGGHRGHGPAALPGDPVRGWHWYREESADMAKTIRAGRLMEKSG